MKIKELQEHLRLHRLWLENNPNGKCANLSYSDLSYANLSYANLSRVNLRGANLSRVNLSRADLSDANLSYADLSSANLSGADLRGADLSSANLSGADLSDAKLPIFQIVPETGNFIAYKKVETDNNSSAILILEVIGKRTSSLIGRKCRTDKVKVLKAEYLDGKTVPKAVKLFSKHDSNFKYLVGKTITCKDYNDDTRVECTTGIHFFRTKKEAIEY